VEGTRFDVSSDSGRFVQSEIIGKKRLLIALNQPEAGTFSGRCDVDGSNRLTAIDNRFSFRESDSSAVYSSILISSSLFHTVWLVTNTSVWTSISKSTSKIANFSMNKRSWIWIICCSWNRRLRNSVVDR
jgi:hypothetical protein